MAKKTVEEYLDEIKQEPEKSRDALEQILRDTLQRRINEPVKLPEAHVPDYAEKSKQSYQPKKRSNLGIIVAGLLVTGCAAGALALGGLFNNKDENLPEPTPIVQVTDAPFGIAETTIEATLEPNYTPKPIATPIPRDEPIDFDIGVPSVSISILDNLNEVPGAVAPIQNAPGGKLSVEVFGGGNPLKDVNFGVDYAVVDIAGKWALDGYVAYEPPASIQLQLNCKTDINGYCETILEPGTYALVDNDAGANWKQLKGIWGIYEPSDFGGGTFFIPFRIDLGKTTEIDINLASLEVGVLSSEGAAMSGEQFYIQCQGEDIAGKKIGVNTCKRYYAITDARGTAHFYLGAGTYMIVHTERYVDEFFPDIILEPGENRIEIITLP